MGRLGYERFGTLGGDWGATMSNYLGLDSPRAASTASTSRWSPPGPPAGSDGSELATSEKRSGWRRTRTFFAEESGYLQIQGTRPQTLAYGLTDSPAGLAGWIVEKLRAWSDCDGDLESAIAGTTFSPTSPLYWVTGHGQLGRRASTSKPCGPASSSPSPRASRFRRPVAIFPKETVESPRSWAEQAWDIRRWTEMPRGGHFAALEVPDLLVADVGRSTATSARNRTCARGGPRSRHEAMTLQGECPPHRVAATRRADH